MTLTEFYWKDGVVYFHDVWEYQDFVNEKLKHPNTLVCLFGETGEPVLAKQGELSWKGIKERL